MTPKEVLRKHKKHVRLVLETARDVYLAKTMVEEETIPLKNQFICIALKSVRDHTDLPERYMVVYALKEIIAERLGNHECLEDWLRQRLKKQTTIGSFDRAVFEKVQTTRVAWINSLIKEFG